MPFSPDPIPYVTPIYVGDRKKTGRTGPFLMYCEPIGGGKREEYIVKLWADPEIHLGGHNLARELYGSLLAKFFEIETPDVSVVQIDSDYYLSQPSEKSSIIRQSAGLNFGSKYLKDIPVFSPPVLHSMHSAAVKIFCFDMLICNQDRCLHNPNTFQSKNSFIIFDHEQAFPYSHPQSFLGGLPPCWDYIKESWHRKHIFYSDIKKKNCGDEIDEFISSLHLISNELLDTIEEQIPAEWRLNNSALQNIRSYLANTRDNSDQFARSLQEVLA